jgi:hypothetical protein
MTNPVRYAVVHLPSNETALVVSLTESKVGLKAGWYRMIFDDEARSAIDGGPYETAEAALVRAVEPEGKPSAQDQLRDDLLIYGTSFARRNADGTIERIDPRDVRFEIRPCEHDRGAADICTKCGTLLTPENRGAEPT